MAVQDLDRIEQKLDRAVAGAVEISDQVGGVLFKDMAQVMEFAKLLSLAGTAIPKHLRGNPGGCLAVTIQALEWRSSPIAVANKSYEVNDRIAYESQLIVAIINARAPLKERLRYVYEGEGVDMKCTVFGLIKGEAKPLDYESPQIKNIKVKNSPLWTSDPRQQLGYYSARAWARRHCPETILGIYAEDELQGAPNVRDITPAKPDVSSRLTGGKGRGFNKEGVDAALEHKPAETLDAGEQAKQPEPVPVVTTQAQPDPQLALPTDVEAEVAAKKRAVQECRTKDDLKALVAITTEFLKDHKRGDLLNDFLSVAAAREKKLEV